MADEIAIRPQTEIERQHHKSFEDAKRQDENGNEYWSARELFPLLDYARWANFEPVIQKAITACENSGKSVNLNFIHVEEPQKSGTLGFIRKDDYYLTRYACYLAVMNGDPKKEVIANAQTYFAIQVRLQELADNRSLSKEDIDQVVSRDISIELDKQVSELFYQYGAQDKMYGILWGSFHRILYGGENVADTHERKENDARIQVYAWRDLASTTELEREKVALEMIISKVTKNNPGSVRELAEIVDQCATDWRAFMRDHDLTYLEDMPTPGKSAPMIREEMKKQQVLSQDTGTNQSILSPVNTERKQIRSSSIEKGHEIDSDFENGPGM